jgi:hypothetical protein
MIGLSRSRIMPTYLVRTIDEHDLVGIFVAPNLLELALLLDEGIDASVCEYQRMTTGGIMWTEPAVIVPVDPSPDAEVSLPNSIPWSEATLTEGWENSVYGSPKGKWRAVFSGEDLYSEEPDDTPTEPAQTGTARILQYRKRGT